MAYCRWSDEDFQCDVYCYGDFRGGYTTHVASNRPVKNVELPPPVALDSENIEAWLARHNKVMEWVETCERKPIGLPHDGESFDTNTASETVELLLKLKAAGYNVPDYAIDALREEAEEGDSTP